eukprot:TRINITY_DN127_c0_g1_i1.p1 TRINITY_DN127_c0_g1~~TRINITY_DN127_c0_g1_i1.p1  ORF type:complete len:446 (+),score=120.25 TRINITY_DN127_c0_g1_i1:30-1340(+)
MGIDSNYLQAKLSNYHIVFVPGFLSQLFNNLQQNLLVESRQLIENVFKCVPEYGPKLLEALPDLEFPMEENSGSTFDILEKYLKSLNITFTDLAYVDGFNSQLGIENNSMAVKNILLNLMECNPNLQILMVTHSKGGMDTLHCFLNHPETMTNIKGWIAYQSPFFGSKIADMAPDLLAKVALETTGGKLESAKDLEENCRFEYMTKHHAQILDIMTRIPTISAGSIFSPDLTESSFNVVKVGLKEVFSTEFIGQLWNICRSHGELSIAIPLAIDAFMKKFNKATINIMKETAALSLPGTQLDLSDGVVPFDSTKLPGAFHVMIPECDHLCATINPMPFRRYYDNDDMVQVFAVLLENMFYYLDNEVWKEFHFPLTQWLRVRKEKREKEEESVKKDLLKDNYEQIVQYEVPSTETTQRYSGTMYKKYSKTPLANNYV